MEKHTETGMHAMSRCLWALPLHFLLAAGLQTPLYNIQEYVDQQPRDFEFTYFEFDHGGSLLRENGSKANTRPSPKVAFHMLGYIDSQVPAGVSSSRMHRFASKQKCAACPHSAPQPDPDHSDGDRPEGWWCAQRAYMESLGGLVNAFPTADFYMLIDDDTAVFPDRLQTLTEKLQYDILKPDEDLYMGHAHFGPRYDHHGIPAFIMTGGGALLRGSTLRRLVQSGQQKKCMAQQQAGWCWHHLDWVLGECFLKIGVKAQGHAAFQQMLNVDKNACSRQAVACHPVAHNQMLKFKRSYPDGLGGTANILHWARPCPDDKYQWMNASTSTCDD